MSTLKFINGPKHEDPTSIWYYFWRSDAKPSNHAKCKTCTDIKVSQGGSTTSLWQHLKKIHKISPPVPDKPVEEKQTKSLYNHFLKKKLIAEEYAEFVAVDGFSFHAIAKSNRIRRGLNFAKLDGVTENANTVRNLVMQYVKDLMEDDRKRLIKIMDNNVRFGLTFDEWTSVRSRRYLNLVLHFGSNGILNLGLHRVIGSANSETLFSLIKNVLYDFGLDFERTIVCIMTDGC